MVVTLLLSMTSLCAFTVGHAWSSSLYCRDIPIANTWNIDISQGAFYCSWDIGNIFYFLMTDVPLILEVRKLLILRGSFHINPVGVSCGKC